MADVVVSSLKINFMGNQLEAWAREEFVDFIAKPYRISSLYILFIII